MFHASELIELMKKSRDHIHINELMKGSYGQDKQAIDNELNIILTKNPDLGSYDIMNGWITIPMHVIKRNRRKNIIKSVTKRLFLFLLIILIGIYLMSFYPVSENLALSGGTIFLISFISLGITISDGLRRLFGPKSRNITVPPISLSHGPITP